MDVLFRQACAHVGHFSAGLLHELLAEYQQDNRAGLLQLVAEDGQRLALILARGRISNGYQFTQLETGLFTAAQWPEILAGLPECSVYSLFLHAQSIRLVKIVLEQYRRGEVKEIADASLPEQLGLWAAQPSMSAVHCRWESAESVFVLPGRRQPALPGLWAANVVIEGVNPSDMLTEQSFLSGRLIRYSAATQSSAWEEYFLNLAFGELIGQALRRYQELSGQGLALGLCQNVSFSAAQRGWEISLANMDVQVGEIFSHPDKAALAYRTLLSMVVHHMYAVLGRGVMESLLREILIGLDGHLVRAIDQYSLLPEAMLPAQLKALAR